MPLGACQVIDNFFICGHCHSGSDLVEVAGGKGGVQLMDVFVKFVVFDTITDREEVLRLRQVVGQQMQKIQESGKVTQLRVFSDARGGFMVVDIDSPEELFELFGSAIIDHFHIETHPLITVETLAEFFERDAAGG